MRQYSSSISDSKSSKTTGEVTSSGSEVVHDEEAAGETGGDEVVVVIAGSMAPVRVVEVAASIVDCCSLGGLMGSTSQGTSHISLILIFCNSN